LSSPTGPDIIVIAGLDDQDPALLRCVAQAVTKIYGYGAEIMDVPHDLSFAFDEARGQYHSTAILELLARKAPPHALKILGITGVDLYIPVLTYVFGEAQLGGRSAILSTFRLREGLVRSGVQDCGDPIVKEAIHELGHTFDLRHCREPGCVMGYCRRPQDVDRKNMSLCRYCRVLLEDYKERLRAS